MTPWIYLKEALSLGGLSVRELAARTWAKVDENEIMTRAAGVSFYAMLASVPFLALVLTLAVQLLPNPATGEPGAGNQTVAELDATLKSLFPPEAYQVVKDQITRIQEQPPVGLLSVGLALTIWVASSLFVAIIDALNRVYGVIESRPFWKLRLTALLMTVVQAIILIGSLLAIAAWPLILKWLGLSVGGAVLATAVKWAAVFVMVLISFALTFYVGPDAEQKWQWITPGSLLGTVVFLLGSLAFGIYVQNWGNYDKTYGSLGGVMVLLFWFWVSSVVLLTAGQINELIEEHSPMGKQHGQKTDPTEPLDLTSLQPEPLSTE